MPKTLLLAAAYAALGAATPSAPVPSTYTNVGADVYEGNTPVSTTTMTPLTACLVDIARTGLIDPETQKDSRYDVSAKVLTMMESRRYTIRAAFTDKADKTERHILINFDTDAKGKPSTAPGSLRVAYTVAMTPDNPQYTSRNSASIAFSTAQTMTAGRLQDLPTAFYTIGIEGQMGQAGAKPVPWSLIDRSLRGTSTLSYLIQKRCAGLGA